MKIWSKKKCFCHFFAFLTNFKMDTISGFSPTFNSKIQHYSSHKPGHFRFMSSNHRNITDIVNDVEGKHNFSFSVRRVLINLEKHYNNNELKKVHELLKNIQ